MRCCGRHRQALRRPAEPGQYAAEPYRKVLITAVARRLAVELWRYLAAGVVPEGAIAAA